MTHHFGPNICVCEDCMNDHQNESPDPWKLFERRNRMLEYVKAALIGLLAGDRIDHATLPARAWAIAEAFIVEEEKRFPTT